MQLRLGVSDDTLGPARWWDLHCPAGADLAWFAERAGLSPNGFVCDGIALDPSATLGRAPLTQGRLIHHTTASTPTRRPHERPLLELRGTAGPAAGIRHPLRVGHHHLGRAASGEVQVTDPTMSRKHLRLEVTPAGIRVCDLGGTNSTDLTDVVDPRGRLLLDREWRAGSSRFRVSATSGAGPAPIGQDGTVTVCRPPLSADERPDVRLTLSAPPPHRDLPRIPWVSMLLPLPVTIALAIWMSPYLLAFGLLGPLVLGGTALVDRRHTRRADTQARDEHLSRLRNSRRQSAEAVRQDLNWLRRHHPGADETADAAGRPTNTWSRRPGHPAFLHLRLGVGPVPSAVSVGPATSDEVPTWHAAAPVVVDLAAHRVVGVSGPDGLRTAVIRHLVGQLAVWHGPDDLQIALVSDDPARSAWDWLPRLPHAVLHGPPVLSTQRAREELLRAAQGVDESKRHRRTLVLLLPDAATEVESLMPASSEAVDGVIVLAGAPTTAGLPESCTRVLDLQSVSRAVLMGGSDSNRELVPDLPQQEWIERIASDLAPMRLPHEDAALPERAHLTQVRTTLPTTPEEVAAAWRANSGTSPGAVLGTDGRRPVLLDLVTDGPHLLLGGTTGAGKSEMLRTLVLSLALRHSPDDVSFVLVDYKGGAALAAAADLPHVTGVITDLDPRLAERALTSLRSELRRRERLLAEAQVSDIEAYAATRGEAMPRLILVIDEFRVLADELPDFLSGVVHLAAVGRSLGIHLVLATQRPAGVISADIAANVSTRIALRMRDAHESVDVIGSPHAASLPSSVPGRAWLRRASGELQLVQTATTFAAPAPPEAAELPWPPPPLPGSTVGDAVPESVSTPAAIVDLVRRARELAGVPASRSPWLPPLRDQLPLPTSPGSDAGVGIALGEVDLPTLQRQEVLRWDPTERPRLAVVGAPGSGRTSTLRCAVVQALQSGEHTQVHVVADATSDWDDLRGHPRLGSVLPRTDLPVCRALLTALQRADPQRSPGRVLLVVDGWDAVTTLSDADDHGCTIGLLRRLTEDGPRSGISVLVSGGRSLLIGRDASLLQHRLLLRLADPVDVAMAGVPLAAVPVHQPPGRGLWLPETVEAQVYRVPPQMSSLDSPKISPAGSNTAAAQCIPRFAPLPDRVQVCDLGPPGPVGTDDGITLDLGVGLLASRTGSVTVRSHEHPVLLVAGPRRSGRSSALAAQVGALLSAGHGVCLIEARPGSVSGLLTERERTRLVTPEATPTVTVCDDLDLVTASATGSTEAENALQDALLRAERGDGLLLVSGLTSTLTSQFRGVVPQIARHGTGVVLQPRGPMDGEILGCRLPAGSLGTRPGRGYLVLGGELTPIQLATREPTVRS